MKRTAQITARMTPEYKAKLETIKEHTGLTHGNLIEPIIDVLYPSVENIQTVFETDLETAQMARDTGKLVYFGVTVDIQDILDMGVNAPVVKRRKSKRVD